MEIRDGSYPKIRLCCCFVETIDTNTANDGWLCCISVLPEKSTALSALSLTDVQSYQVLGEYYVYMLSTVNDQKNTQRRYQWVFITSEQLIFLVSVIKQCLLSLSALNWPVPPPPGAPEGTPEGPWRRPRTLTLTQEFNLSNCNVETHQQVAERDKKPQKKPLSWGLPGREPVLGYDGEQLVTAATAVCSADDVSTTELPSHRAVWLQQTLSNGVCLCVWHVCHAVWVCVCINRFYIMVIHCLA